MADVSILTSARRDTSKHVHGEKVLVVVCALVLAFNWKYVYNFAAGPFPFDPIAAGAAPHSVVQEFVRVTGPVVPTGWGQETTVRLLRGLVEPKDLSAKFLAVPVGGRILIVKVPGGFSGETVEGRLVPLPSEVRGTLGAVTYAWMIDARTDYRRDFNVFVAVAALLLVGAAATAGAQQLPIRLR